ncbi:MAG: hypothetical protein ACOC1G_08325, partial [Phycisphaeraceae bacterium]
GVPLVSFSNLATWGKSNPITVASIAVAAVSLGVIVYVVITAGGLRSEIGDRRSMFNTTRQLMSQSIEVPSEAPDGRPDYLRNMAISPQVIDRMRGIYERMRDQLERVFERAEGINRPDRQMLVEDLFPNAARTADLPITARFAYRRKVPMILGQPVDDDNLVRLNAGEPPDAATVGLQLAEDEREFRRQYQGASGEDVSLTPEQERQLREEKRDRTLQMIRDQAEAIHLYAALDPDDDAFPFAMRESLVNPAPGAGSPTPALLWEAQLELWIMEDIARAIARVNAVDNPDANVATAPVKRLLNVAVLPGYVGIHTKGGLEESTSRRSGTMRVTAEGMYDPPDHPTLDDPDQQLDAAFHYTPTGRVSNALYDVRHAQLRAVVDVRKLPELLDELSHVNFMTVLRVETRDVNEFEALREGYFYGTGDAVEVMLLIESIWLRSWTESLMPDTTKRYLGIIEPLEESESGNYGERGGPRGPDSEDGRRYNP